MKLLIYDFQFTLYVQLFVRVCKVALSAVLAVIEPCWKSVLLSVFVDAVTK